MINITRILSMFLALALLGCEANRSNESSLPPLLDRALFFGHAQVNNAQLSPLGDYIAVIKPFNGVPNIHIQKLGADLHSARPITADSRPIDSYHWSRDGRYILYLQDKNGDENPHLFAVDPFAKSEPETEVPLSRDLTPVPGIQAKIYAVPLERPEIVLIGMNQRDPANHDLYELNIITGEMRRLVENTARYIGYLINRQGVPRFAIQKSPTGDTVILALNGSQARQIYQCSIQEYCGLLNMHADQRRVYMLTNKGDSVDLGRLVILDPENGKVQFVESDPLGETDFYRAKFSPTTDELLFSVYWGDRYRIYARTDQIRADLKLLRAQLPKGELTLGSTTDDMNLWLVGIDSDVNPGSTFLYNRTKQTVELLFHSRPDLPSQHLAPMQSIRYATRDGEKVPAYLTLPKGKVPAKLPTIIFVHGGPWARDYWGYDSYTQFLANRGYAVLQPNFRGSDGFGKRFLNAGNRSWGVGTMQHDITDGLRYLIDNGFTDPKRVCIFGASYGGYATLAGVAFTPDLYTCGIPYVAPSNLITLMKSYPDYWESFLEVLYTRVGNPNIAADREDLKKRSPLFFADQIKAPLLVVHGANDPRVKQHEADQIVASLRDRGKRVEYLLAQDEGHGFRSYNNRMALAVAIERFLAEQIGGRYQQEIPEQIDQRLQELQVDLKTVSVSNK